jgi:hypothetical protein
VNKAEKLDQLVTSVEDLLAKLPEKLDPAISALRDRVDDGIFDAWTAITRERVHQLQRTKGAPSKMGVPLVIVLCACTAAILLRRSRH